MSAAYNGISTNNGVPGISGTNDAGDGVVGVGHRGVVGRSVNYQGVFGHSAGNAGVVGESQAFHGVYGVSHGVHNGALFGTNDAGGFGVIGRGLIGVTGESTGGLQGLGVLGFSPGGDGVVGRGHRGVRGESDEFHGVSGHSNLNVGVFGESDQLSGVYAVSHHPQNAGLYATNDRGGPAAFFEGKIVVTGDIALTNADCAEDFDISADSAAEPGSVMVLNDDGGLRESFQAYDKRVAGVVSGAGSCKPGIVLDKQTSLSDRKPIALLGKVFCKVDAQFGPIAVGDLLTTSPTAGHAMRADDAPKAFGTVIGKALRPHDAGQGLIPILIALQ